MNNIDFEKRVNTYTNQVQDILSEYFDDYTGLGANIRGAAMEIGSLYASREHELMHDILEMVEKSFGVNSNKEEKENV